MTTPEAVMKNIIGGFYDNILQLREIYTDAERAQFEKDKQELFGKIEGLNSVDETKDKDNEKVVLGEIGGSVKQKRVTRRFKNKK